MIDAELEERLTKALAAARSARRLSVGIEDALLFMIDNVDVVEVLEACKVDIARLQFALEDHIANPDLSPVGSSAITAEPEPTKELHRVMQRAIQHVSEIDISRSVNCVDVLVAMFNERDSHAIRFLQAQGVRRLDVVNFISHGVRKDDQLSGAVALPNSRSGTNDAALQTAEILINLNKRAAEGDIDPIIGREHEMERVVQILCRRRKNNPLLVGEPGVGKTAIAEGLAYRVVQDEVPDPLKNTVVYLLDLGAMVAGTKFRGDFEQRLKDVLKFVQQTPNSILFIDEIHTIIGAGASSGGTLDAANLLKPALASGKLRCLGATTIKEYRGIFEKDHALARRFQKVDVGEPSIEETVRILNGIKSSYEEHHSVAYTDEAIRSAVLLSIKHINDRQLPDKAIDVIDEAGAAVRLASKKSADKRQVERAHIEAVVAKIARIPKHAVEADEIDRLGNLEKNLKSVVFGQDTAVVAVADAVKASRAGLGNPNKPICSLMFAGPTGVGKTEVAKQVARILGIELVRFDMSEYMERHTVSRLIGSPPGYVGFEQGGLLTESIVKHPHCVLLLDEIEKAHPDMFNLLLQVMDNGTLTDNNGRRADFRNVIIIMTTNAGAQDASRRAIGFADVTAGEHNIEEIKRVFSPEFRNRLDAVVQFKLLDGVIGRVVDKFLLVLEQQLNAKHVEVHFTDRLRNFIAETGYDPEMGARPMERMIQDLIRKALADELLFGRLAKGGDVTIDVDQSGAVRLDIVVSTSRVKTTETS